MMTTATILNSSSEEQKPERQTFTKCLRNNLHLFCLILTLLIVACLTTILWCNVSSISRFLLNVQSLQLNGRRRTSSCDDGYIFIPIAFVIMLYLTYLVECWHSSTRLNLASTTDVKTALNYIQQMKNAQPLIWWKAICYHYIRRSRQITRYRNGESFTTTQIYYERINTHIAGSCFSFNSLGVKDVSKDLDLDNYPTIRIQFSKGFAFATMEAASEFEDQRNRFMRESECHDEYLEMREGLDLIGCNFQENLTAIADKTMVPWYISHLSYWIFSFLLLSWPIRIMIELKTAHVHYQITKLFGVNCLNSSSSPERIDSIDSMELCHNNCLAPSYSEAILMSNADRLNDRENLNTVNHAKMQHQLDPQVSSQSSLINGRLVYLPRPLECTLMSSYGFTSNTHRGHNNDQPPSYEEAVSECTHISGSGLMLRRSFTDRNILGRLNEQLRKPWDSLHDFLGITRQRSVDL